MSNLVLMLTIAGTIVVALILLGTILARLYHRATKEVSFVRTGFGGEKVVKDGGSLVLPVLHEVIQINMNTLRLPVQRRENEALITRDRMRVDVAAEFYVRVAPTQEAIANAAQTLGAKTMAPESLKGLVEGKFVDALRSVAAKMTMQELHEQRSEFVQSVQSAVAEDLNKNGLELESVSLTGLDQTAREYFNPDNAFDAEGLTKLTEEIEIRRQRRNEIEQETLVSIKRKNLEAAQQTLTIEREEEYARLEQQREIEIRRAAQAAEIARQRAEREQEAEQASIEAQRNVEVSRIESERAVEQQSIEKRQVIETREVERRKALELAEQERMIAISEKSKSESEAKAQADQARALAVKAQEDVETTRARAAAERAKEIQIIQAREDAERQAVGVRVAAEAEKLAAEDRKQARLLEAQASAEAEERLAQAKAKTYEVEAEGKRRINEAQNTLSGEMVAMQLRLALIEQAPEIIKQSVKPMESIDGIKILHVDGLFGGAGGGDGHGHGGAGGGSFADQLVNSALRYRGQVPLVDSLLGEMGIDGRSLGGLTRPLSEDPAVQTGEAAVVEADPIPVAPVTEPAPELKAKAGQAAPVDTAG